MAALLVVAVAMAFATSVATPFFLDDGEAIERNPYLTTLTPLSRALTAPPQSAVSGRPLISLSLALNYAAGGLDPAGFHLANLAVHAAATLLLWGLLRRTLRSPQLPAVLRDAADPLAVAATLLWAVHPLHTEVVAYVVARSESVMGLCYLLSLYALARGSDGTGSRGWLGVAVAACALGTMAKESIVTAPLMALLYDVTFVAGSVREAVRRRGWVHAGLFASWGLLAAWHWDLPRFRSAGFDTGLSSWDYLLTQGPMVLHYLQLAVWPQPLIADYGLTSPTSFAAVWPAVVLVGALAGGAIALWWRHRPLAFLATWFFVTLAPASSVVPIATEVGAERRMYLPLIAVVVLAVVGARTLMARLGSGAGPGRIGMAAVAVAAVGLAAVSAARGREYRDPVGIWERVVDKRPHARARHNLGIALAARGRLDEALAQYRLAADSLPEAGYSLGFALAERGDDTAAMSELRKFLARRPDDAAAPRATNLLGLLAMGQGDLPAAVAAYERTLAMRPNDGVARRGLAEALTALGAALAEEGRLAAAVDAFARAAAAAPEAPGAHLNHGTWLMQLGRASEGVQAFRRGLAQAPGSVPLRNALAAALATQGARDEAIAEFSRALAIDPGNADAQAGLRRLQSPGSGAARR